MRGGGAAGRSAVRRAATVLSSSTSIETVIWETASSRWCGSLQQVVIRGCGGNQATATHVRTSSSVLRSFHSSAAAPRAVGPVGGAAASMGARAAVNLVSSAIVLRTAQGAYHRATTETFRSRVQGFIFGRTYTGLAARVAGLTAATGAAVYALVEPVPATGRWRLNMFDHDTEVILVKPNMSYQFQKHWNRFVPPNDPRAQRVAAVLWKLVNRLDPSLTTWNNNNDDDNNGGGGGAGTRGSAAANAHPMLREGSQWTVHVIDSPMVNAWVSPGGHIFVCTGLLKAIGRDDNSLAFVLAHEMGHTLARHHAEKTTLEMLKGLHKTFLWGLAATMGADVFGGILIATALMGAEAATDVAVSLPYSRAMEREADDLGMRILSRACFDPAAGPRVMRMFQHYETRVKQLAEAEAEAAAAAAAASSSSSPSKAAKWRKRDALRIAQVSSQRRWAPKGDG